MKIDLLRRIKDLEATTQEISAPRRSIVPEWLLKEWQGQGLQFDPSNDASVRRAMREMQDSVPATSQASQPSSQDLQAWR